MVINGSGHRGGAEIGMNIHIITYAFSHADSLLRTFAAADGPDVTWHLFLHSEQRDVVAACELLDAHSNVIYYPYGTDRGLARSCNEGILRAQAHHADVVIQLCDDITARPGDIQRLAEAVLANSHCSHVTGRTYVERGQCWQSGGFDACAINLRAIEAIGYFDVNFWPVNFEDIDWKRRAMLSGYEPVHLNETSFTHHDCNPSAGSGEFMEKFYRTRAYYEAKWGADQGDERWEHPFNDSRFGLTIPRECIDNPYPDYKREDIPA